MEKEKNMISLYGHIIFEGEYLNGQMNGIGKEYYDDSKLKYEGKYLNGKRWFGIEKVYYGKLEFEIINGNGKVKEYYDNGKLRFEGEYLNGKRNGKGKEYDFFIWPYNI